MLYLTLDQPKWIEGDFSSSSKLTGTVYTDNTKTTAKNLTGYTLTVRIFKRWNSTDYFNKTATITVAASGTWNYPVAQYVMPSAGIYLLTLELTKSGEQLKTYPEEFEIIEAPQP